MAIGPSLFHDVPVARKSFRRGVIIKLGQGARHCNWTKKAAYQPAMRAQERPAAPNS
jgi:hypothetical protein